MTIEKRMFFIFNKLGIHADRNQDDILYFLKLNYTKSIRSATTNISPVKPLIANQL